MKVVIIVAALFIIVSCQHQAINHYDRAYEVVNHIISDQYYGYPHIEIFEEDSIFFNGAKLDPLPNRNIKIDSVEGRLEILFHNWVFDGFLNQIQGKNYYQAPNTLETVPGQIENWESQKIDHIILSDSAAFNNDMSEFPDLRFWYLLTTKDEGYISITEPIFNLTYDNAIVGIVIYTEKYCQLKLVNLNNDKTTGWEFEHFSIGLFKHATDNIIQKEDHISSDHFVIFNGFYEK